MTFAGTPAQKIGTIDKILESSVISQIDNDGNHQYLHIQEECKNQLPLTIETKQLMVPLTNPNVDVVQFDKSFITLAVDVTFALDCDIHDVTIGGSDPFHAEALVNMYKGAKVFIGFKNSTDCVGSRAVYHNGKLLTGTLQDHGSQESFIYHSYRNQEDLIKHKGIYTLAEAVDDADDTSICGVFVSMYDLYRAKMLNNNRITITFNLTIPFNDNLIFEDFVEYPNALFGDLEYYFRFNKDAMVYKMCNPLKSVEKYFDGSLDNDHNWKATVRDALNGFPLLEAYDKEYAQIGDPVHIIRNYNYDVDKHYYWVDCGDLTMTPLAISVNTCYSTIVGYKMRPDVLDQQRIKYQSQPWVKFSQNVTTMPFSQGATTSGLAITQQTYLNNVTDFVLTFPMTDREITVSKNPMLDEFTLGTMGRKYPEQPLDTTSDRFCEIMLNASDVFTGQPRKEYVDSISIPRPATSSMRKPITDLTSFLLTLKVERPSALGLIFDGLDSEGKSVSVRVDAKHKYPTSTDNAVTNPPVTAPAPFDPSTFEAEQTELIPSGSGPVGAASSSLAEPHASASASLPTNALNRIPPVLYICNDSFFIFNSRDGGRCIYSDRDFNAVCQGFMSGAYVP